MNELWTLSSRELAARIRRRELSPVEAVEAHIERIGAVNGAINALAAERFERARDEARAAEERLARAEPEDLPPLFGVPCTVKEFVNVEGMPNTGGILARKHLRATADATVVQRLRAAGAIIMGAGNVPEGGMWMETANKIYGRTNNPWNLRHTPGGSSGGEAALVAAGASPFGIGSDVAGSIRIPSAFCGVAGHKPTGGLVPNTGHWGPEGAGPGPFLTTGPIGRTVGDCEVVLRAIAGPDQLDTHCVRRFEDRPGDRRDLAKVVVYPITENSGVRISEVMREHVRRAATALGACGAEVREVPSPLKKILAVWARAMTEAAEGGPSFVELLGDGQPVSLLREAAMSCVGRSRIMVFSLGFALLERLTATMPRRLAGVTTAAALRDELEELLGDTGVILHPPYTRPAPRHHHALLTPFDFVCTGVFNIVQFPVTQVPTGLDNRGLPVGVQVASRRGNDALTLAVAAALEEDFGTFGPANPTPARRAA